MNSATGRLIVFAREPVPGFTKTRLEPALGQDGAADLARKMTRHTLTNIVSSDIGDVILYTSGNTEEGYLESLSREFAVPATHQSGTDLGVRMCNAMARELEIADWVILVGTDCPTMHVNDLEQAATGLQAAADAVIGPAEDGGYYLIGLRRVEPCLFTDIEWGGGDVYAVTRKRLDDLGWQVEDLPVRRDIDLPEDLAYLPPLLS